MAEAEEACMENIFSAAYSGDLDDAALGILMRRADIRSIVDFGATS
jgi:hypothetical protein